MKTAKTVRETLSDDRAQMIPTAALAMVVITMVIFGMLYLGVHLTQRRGLQNTADAAALAGAQELNGKQASEALAVAKAQEYIDAHVSNLTSPAEIVVADNYTSIKVTVRKKPNVSFGFIGDATIAAKAKARVASPRLPGPGVVPLAVDEATWEECVQNNGCSDLTLKEWSGNNSNPPSDYHLLDLPGGSGASGVCDFLIGGGTQPIQDPVPNKPGNVSSLHNCLVDRMDAATANSCLTLNDVLDNNGNLEPRCNPLDGAKVGSLAEYPDAQPTSVILVPVIKQFAKGSADLDIVGDGVELRTFAFFWINPDTVYGPSPTCVDSGQCNIYGNFIQSYFAALAVNDGGTTDFDPDGVLKVVQLIE